jgi:ankyrin repeat protein
MLSLLTTLVIAQFNTFRYTFRDKEVKHVHQFFTGFIRTMLINLLKQLLITVRAPSNFQTVLMEAGCSMTSIDLFFREERISRTFLIDLSNKWLCEKDLERAIRAFLRKRWAIVRGTNSAYVSFPHSPMNQICIQLAQKIVKPAEPLIQVLMPTVKILDYIVTSEDLITLTEIKSYRGRELAFWNFIISQDGRAIIHLGEWFRAQALSQGEYFNHLYASGSDDPTQQAVPLTEDELNHLRCSALPASNDFFDQFEFRRSLIRCQGTLSGALLNLCDGLMANGQGSKKGSVSAAHDDVFSCIREFGEILESLPEDDRTKVLSISDFAKHWRIISGHDWKYRSTQGVGTCVESNANGLKTALEKNLDIFSAIKVGSGKIDEEARSSLSSFAQLLENIHGALNARQQAYKSFLSTGSLQDAQVSLKLPHPMLACSAEMLAAYHSHLNETEEKILVFSLSHLSVFNYFQQYYSKEEMNARLDQHDPEVLLKHFKYAMSENIVPLMELLILRQVLPLPEITLHDLVALGNIRLVRAYIQAKRNLNFRPLTYLFFGDPMDSALEMAIAQEKFDIAALLVEAGADCARPIKDMQMDHEFHILTYAVHKNHLPLVKALVSRADIDINGSPLDNAAESYSSPLHYAVENASLEIIRLLLAAGADPLIERQYRVPSELIRADTASIEEEIILLFLRHGVRRLSIRMDTSRPILIYALERNYHRVAQFIVNHANEMRRDVAKALYRAANTSVPNLRKLLDLGVDPNFKFENGMTALHVAVGQPSVDAVFLLLERGASILEVDILGKSVLHHAIISDCGTLITHLLNLCAHQFIHSMDNGGKTPLTIAIAQRSIIMVSAIIQSEYYDMTKLGGELEALSPSQLSPFLHYCLRLNQSPSVIATIVSAGGFHLDLKYSYLRDSQIYFSYSLLLEHPSLSLMHSVYGFENLCDLARIKIDSMEGLRLYTACILNRFPPEQMNTLKALIPHAKAQIIWESLLAQRPYVGKFWSKYDPLYDMPKALKLFAKGERDFILPLYKC